jgi:hypothetical protein
MTVLASIPAERPEPQRPACMPAQWPGGRSSRFYPFAAARCVADVCVWSIAKSVGFSLGGRMHGKVQRAPWHTESCSDFYCLDLASTYEFSSRLSANAELAAIFRNCEC